MKQNQDLYMVVTKNVFSILLQGCFINSEHIPFRWGSRGMYILNISFCGNEIASISCKYTNAYIVSGEVGTQLNILPTTKQHSKGIFYIQLYVFLPDISIMVRVFANGSGSHTKESKKWYLMPPYLTLSIIKYGSRVKWVNPGKGVVPSCTLGVVAIEKGAFRSPLTTVVNNYMSLVKLLMGKPYYPNYTWKMFLFIALIDIKICNLGNVVPEI